MCRHPKPSRAHGCYDPELWNACWCFEPSQPQRIISGLRETFVKRYIVERTIKAEIRPEEQSEKLGVVGRIYEMKYSWKSHKDRNKHKNRIKRSGQAWLVYDKKIRNTLRARPIQRYEAQWYSFKSFLLLLLFVSLFVCLFVCFLFPFGSQCRM